jgi:hypothetical protein
MFKVICINGEAHCEAGCTNVVKGNMYHVIDDMINEKKIVRGHRSATGLYYKLIETGFWYHHDLFIIVNDNQQDETTFEHYRQYNLNP